MMTLEHFKTVIEIQSLFNMINTVKSEIKNEEGRITQIETQRCEKADELSNKENELKKIKQEILEVEKNLSDIEHQLAKSEEHVKTSTNAHNLQSIEDNINNLKSKKDDMENKGLELMDSQEVLQNEVDTLLEFAKGSFTTLNEIKKEVRESVREKESDIKSNQERISNLLSTCPISLQDIIKDLQKQLKSKNIITYVEDNTCIECHYAVNRNLQSQIEIGNVLESCPSCGRILIPESARK